MLAYISEMKFRRIRGYRELRHLENILKNKLEKRKWRLKMGSSGSPNFNYEWDIPF